MLSGANDVNMLINVAYTVEQPKSIITSSGEMNEMNSTWKLT